MSVKYKPIKGFGEYYHIGDDGSVKALEREVEKNNGIIHKRKERFLSPILKDGYLRVVLYKNNTSKNFYLHVLVAEHFIPNPENKKEVNHKDGDKTNCAKSNLEWNTRSENIKHMWDNNLRKR